MQDRSSAPRIVPDSLTRERIAALKSRLRGPIASRHNVDLLSPLTRRQREQFARESGTVVLYLGDEVPAVMRAEEDAAMRAAPAGYPPVKLIGLNIGCGGRTISPYLIPVDIMRESGDQKVAGEHAQLTRTALLARPDDLPFRSGTIDYIVALHMLEHVEDPTSTIGHWLDIVKPGGGVGVVVPDWRYAWDARHDQAPYGHKWNPTPDLVRRLYVDHWRHRADLERLDSYGFAGSFDFVLRKRGHFLPFSPPDPKTMKSGAERHSLGIFLHGE